ncbi:aldehyde oxidase 2-like [Macrosteles quadrilineatus]|uniref:aldehyde oxidase 2-like n=1 Tax=Macrosteles quadrilineatus TaxID=74068 RepID=UPI0023E286FD|nr:aldehyde oxidase 2-like [Macrosteles quadrilineatus]
MESQYHFCMETLTCLVVPKDGDELDVYCSTQSLMLVQEAIAQLLNIPENKINISLRALGGSYGFKLSRGNLVGCAVSLAAHLLNRPVRMITKLETLMEATGKRYPCYFSYEAGVNNEGIIQYVNTDVYEDDGSAFNDPVVAFRTYSQYPNIYELTTWGTKMQDVKTDKTCNIWARSPGSLEAITMSEHIVEHIAHELRMDPLSLRMKNVDPQYVKSVDKMVSLVKEKSDFENRKIYVEDFNKKNVWKKRGISLVPMKFSLASLGTFHAMVSIYRNDGTVAVTHAGVEMGQGINTKAAQACAAALKIPLDKVRVKATDNLTSPNDTPTGGSFTSEAIVL